MKRPVIWGIAGIALLIAGSATVFQLKFRNRPVPGAQEPPAGDAQASAEGEVKSRVVLPPAKFEAAGLHSTAVDKRALQQTRTVPGKIEYRSIRRVDLKAPVESIVRDVLVKPGDEVQPGTRLAVLESPEIGMVRAEVEKNEAELAIAAQAFGWAEQVTQHLEELLRSLKSSPKPQDVELEFENKLLGDHRQKVLGAYSRYVLADQLSADIQPLAANGSISMLTVKTRETNREVAKAEFRAVCEQSKFEAIQQREKGRANMDYARRLLDVSRQKLKTLLGAFTEVPEIPKVGTTDGSELTRYFVVAPFAGTVEQRSVANSQRVTLGAPLFVVANTDTLEAYAEIREREWQALTLQPGQSVTVKIPALGGREFVAKVDYVGRAVSPETQAVPLVAILANDRHLLKPGMFAWISLPMAVTDAALVVPPSAVLTHDGKTFVFVEDGQRTYRRVDVTTGAETNNWIVVTGGLRAREMVVDRGAFLLKSELLKPEEEE